MDLGEGEVMNLVSAEELEGIKSGTWHGPRYVERLLADLEAAEARERKLREALAFYANADGYNYIGMGALLDLGKIARIELAKNKT